MSNIFNKTNSPYLIAGTLATLALLASEVFIAAPYFKFLAPVASLNVSFPLVIGCAVVSFAVLAFSCVMIASNIMKTESDDKVPILIKVEECDQPDNEQEKGNKPDSEPKEGAKPDSQANRAAEGTKPDSEPKADAQHDNQADRAAGHDNQAEGAKPDSEAKEPEEGANQADGTAAVPDIVRDALSDTYSKSGKVKEEQHAKVFAFANFVIVGIAIIAANFLAGLIHNGVAVEGNGVALANDQYRHEYGSTQFEAGKKSKGTNHLLQEEAVQSEIVVFLKALKASNEGLSTALKEGKARGWDVLPSTGVSVSNIQSAMVNGEALAY